MVDDTPRIAELRGRLEAVAEELADLALDALRQAVNDGAESRPELERRLTRARTAVEKAVRLLDG
jgi:hypothetical protein